MPDFCPIASTRLPLGSAIRLADVPRSWSGPWGSGQFVWFGTHATLTHVDAPQLVRPHDPARLESHRDHASLVSVTGAE